MVLAWPSPLPAQSKPSTPGEHRALYLYNFAKFTEWPPSAFADEQAPFVLGILGEDPFKDDIGIIKGKLVKKRRLVVKYFDRVEEIAGCHLLFISNSEEADLANILATLAQRSVLTVTEVDHSAPAQGMINLMVVNKLLAFEIDQAAAESAGLKLDAQLLRLARTVKKRKEVAGP